MRRKRIASGWLVAAVALGMTAVGCSADEPTDPATAAGAGAGGPAGGVGGPGGDTTGTGGTAGAAVPCTPGASQACIGPGNCSGTQICTADGSGFAPCQCYTGTGGAIAVCTPGQPTSCTGADGCPGMQVCVADGSGYGACDCAAGGTDGIAAGGTGGTGGGGTGDPFEATVVPSQNGNLWTLGFGNITFQADADVAGRIITFSIDGVNLLTDSSVDGLNYGSSFWLSPQNWPWPPPASFNTSPYSARLEGNVIVMDASDDYNGLRVTKRFWANEANQVVTIEYILTNDGGGNAQVAPWEVTRVYPGGLSFFPQGPGGVVDSGRTALTMTTSDSVRWYTYSSAITTDHKSNEDGAEGWLAHISCGAGLEAACGRTGQSPVFIKAFLDIPASSFAPGEADIEIYANGGNTYIELENQGAYETIPPGGSISMTVHWYLRYLPANTAPSPSTDLANFVRGVIL